MIIWLFNQIISSGGTLSKGTSIPVKWNTKRKLEKTKFDLETELERTLTWDDFFNLAEIKNTVKKRGGK